MTEALQNVIKEMQIILKEDNYTLNRLENYDIY